MALKNIFEYENCVIVPIAVQVASFPTAQARPLSGRRIKGEKASETLDIISQTLRQISSLVYVVHFLCLRVDIAM